MLQAFGCEPRTRVTLVVFLTLSLRDRPSPESASMRRDEMWKEEPDAADFVNFMFERERIYHRKTVGDPWPWTECPVLRKYSFTNVFRENDKVTKWFRENIREPNRANPEVILHTIAFRWFNRIETGETLLKSRIPGLTVIDQMVFDSDFEGVEEHIREHQGNGPFVTGAYMILSPKGMEKLPGVIHFIRECFDDHGLNLREVCRDMMEGKMDQSAELLWEEVRKVNGLGDFMAYEVVTDLLYTDVLKDADDRMTWANPGPGAERGMNRVLGRDKWYRQKKELFIDEMRGLLGLINKKKLWDEAVDEFKKEFAGREINLTDHLEMREIEHSLCEYDKLRRVLSGEGRPRSVYRR